MFKALRESEPAKIISGILPPRKLLTDCSPNTQRMASVILLLPEPLGPTTAVTLFSKSITVRSAKDLNPAISIFFKYTNSCSFQGPAKLQAQSRVIALNFVTHYKRLLVPLISWIFLGQVQSSSRHSTLPSQRYVHGPGLLL